MDRDVNCMICNEKIKINGLATTPPICGGNNIDEGFYHSKLNGYICTKCFDKAEWSKEELETLKHDWGYSQMKEIFQNQPIIMEYEMGELQLVSSELRIYGLNEYLFDSVVAVQFKGEDTKIYAVLLGKDGITDEETLTISENWDDFNAELARAFGETELIKHFKSEG